MHEMAFKIGAFKYGSRVDFIADVKPNFASELIKFLFDLPDLLQCLPIIDGNPQQLVLNHSQLAILRSEIAESSEAFLRLLRSVPPFAYPLQFGRVIL